MPAVGWKLVCAGRALPPGAVVRPGERLSSPRMAGLGLSMWWRCPGRRSSPHAWRTCVARWVYRDALREPHQRRHAHPRLGNYMSGILGNYVSGNLKLEFHQRRRYSIDDRKVITTRPTLDSGTGPIAPLRRHRAELRTCTS